jgi:hypothetical protein
MAIEVNVTKEIGKFYQNKKTMEYSHWVLKNRMLKVWISIWNEFAFASIVYGGKRV